jgi:uncharacterized protein YdeI (YjbR/CyaY-like superfamily)
MSSARDPRIDVYIAAAAPFAQPILRHLRKLVHEGCPGATETLKWSAPTFEYAGRILCNMAAFKAHCAFGFWHQGMNEVVAASAATVTPAMGDFGRITSVDDLPPDRTMVKYVRQAAVLNATGIPGRPSMARAPKKELQIPVELAAALKRNKPAATTFEKFSPSHRREYIEWIAEAKRDETRQKRLATTLAWLAEGKSRNWKYINC